MTTRTKQPSKTFVTGVYLTLMALTLVTFYIGENEMGGLEIALFVLGIAILKGHLVGAYFMGLSQVQGPWRWPVSIWLIIPGTLITWAFVLAT